ncbi:glycine--tRNA ligase [Ostertagia ostertagi]
MFIFPTYDFGPMGCALKANMLQEWRKHFVLEEGMLEVDCTSLTPEAVITKFGFKSPTTGNDLTPPIAFNLMFPSQIGPTGDFKAYLRPETAQGIFVNFKRLLEFNQGKLPFAAAQIGLGFRNEISPRQGLIRVREFTMCEIEHFVDPNDKTLPKFKKVRSYPMVLFSACNQMDGQPAVSMTIGEAVEKGVVANETLGYYMARTHMYLVKVGVDSRRLRFRQHLGNEMAHYAQDCWDAEILTSYGWIECVGNADRSCYDLTQHSKATNTKLVAEKKLDEPRTVNVVEVVPNMAILGKEFKKDAKRIQIALAQMSEENIENLEKQIQAEAFKLKVDDDEFSLTSNMLTVKRSTKTVHVEEITPSVIEPSFGIGRVMYAVLEHSFRQREGDEQRTFLALRPLVAPIKCSVLPISANERLNPIIEAVCEELNRYELSHRVDDSAGSIGRRYARTDEIGIPFGVTVDFESEKEPWTVTVRHAESMEQIRVELTELGSLVSALSSERMDWDTAKRMYPIFEAKSD